MRQHGNHPSPLFIIAAELNHLDTPARRVAAMRLRALLRPLGALGQRTERRIASLTIESSRARSPRLSP